MCGARSNNIIPTWISASLRRGTLLKNMSLADIEALDEDAFMAKINKWKNDNGLEADAVEAQRKRNAECREKTKGPGSPTVKFTLATGCTTHQLSKPKCAADIKQLARIEYIGNKCTGKRVGQPCKICIKFVGDLQVTRGIRGTAPSLKPRRKCKTSTASTSALRLSTNHVPRTAAPKPQGAKKAKKAKLAAPAK